MTVGRWSFSGKTFMMAVVDGGLLVVRHGETSSIMVNHGEECGS